MSQTLPIRPLCPGGRSAHPLPVTALGLGGAGIGGCYGPVDEAQAIATVRAALELGVTYFDTSPLYLDSERKLGLALPPSDRARVVLSTKVGTHPRIRGYTADHARRSLENSLRELRTDHVDLCLIHDPEPQDLAVALGPGGALDYLVQAKERGLIAAVGLGVRSHAFHRQAIATGRMDAVLTYRDYTLIDRSAAQGVFPAAQEAGVGVILGSPFAAGLLGGSEPRVFAAGRATPEAARAQRVWEWARDHGVEMTALAVQFGIRHPAVATVLAGASHPDEIRRDVEGALAPIPEGTWRALEAWQAAQDAPPDAR